MFLTDTIPMMESADYVARFKAEYYQTKIRYEKLRKMMAKYQAGTLNFQPKCSLDLLKQQANTMFDYLYFLEIRAEVEQIEL